MTIGGHYNVFRKVFTNEHHDYLLVGVSTPYIGQYCHTDWANEDNKHYTAGADSKISWVKSDMHWHFGVQILGFGFYLKRQWGY